MKIKFILCIQFFSLICLAKNKPDWTFRSVKSDSQYKYYVGRASNVANESSAISQATKDAYEQAHRENFGSEIQINSETYQTNTTATSVARISEKTKIAKFEDFEQIDFYLEKNDDNRFDAWVLYKFPVLSITLEKKRLKNITDEPSTKIIFSAQGSEEDQLKGVLQVSTDPQGAVLIIDGERYGKTPIQLNGQLEEGEHRLRIDHLKYETIEEKILIGRNQVVKINKTLIRSSGFISIRTDVPNANVVVNGQYVGLTPVTDIKVEAGIKHKVEISHAETEKYTQEVEVNKNDSRELDIKLPMKPAYISLNVDPSESTIELNGVSFGSALEKLQAEAGLYTIKISKEGYVSEEMDVTLKGAEKLVLDSVKLVSISEIQKRIEKNPKYFTGSVSLAGSPIRQPGNPAIAFNMGFEKKFTEYFGLGINAEVGAFDNTKNEKDTGTVNSTENYLSKGSYTMGYVQLPVYLSQKISLGFSYGFADLIIKSTQRKYNNLGIGEDGISIPAETKQKFYGVTLRYFAIRESLSKGWFFETELRDYTANESYKNMIGGIKVGIFNRF